MNPNEPPDFQQFTHRIRSGEITPEEVASLEAKMLGNPALRRQYREHMRLEANLLATCRETPIDIIPLMDPARDRRTPGRWPRLAMGMGIAAALLLGLFALLHTGAREQGQSVAVLISESEAAWSSNSRIISGEPLSARQVELKEGLAELKFASGAVVTLEAPARLELIDPMRCLLHHGMVVVEVPDSAKGFVVETRDGYAVDHGTRFSVNVSGNSRVADFEVLEGLITVHHQDSGQELSLGGERAARVTPKGLKALALLPSRQIITKTRPGTRLLRTNGREATIVRTQKGDWQNTLLDPALLMVKRDVTRKDYTPQKAANYARDRRALLAFELNDTPAERIQQVRLRLNLVPSGLGYASRLPDTSSFHVYGVRDDAQLETWPSRGLRWEEAPGSVTGDDGQPALSLEFDGKIDASEVELLGSFEIPRGMNRGTVVFESSQLTEFVKQDTTGVAGFLIVRTTPPLDAYSLVHAFASSSHPDAAGPTLEVDLTDAGAE